MPGEAETHTLVDRSALSSCPPCLEYPSLPRNTEHTVDTQEALRLRGQGQRWRGNTEPGETRGGNDGAVKTEKLRAEKHLEGCERHIFQKAKWDLVLCPVYDLNQLNMGDCKRVCNCYFKNDNLKQNTA